MPPNEQIEYAQPATKTPGIGRSATKWAKLLAVWAIGLVSWSLYLVAILYLWIKFL